MNAVDIISLKILDVISIKRSNSQTKTNNKSCAVISCRISGESTFLYDKRAYSVKRGDILYLPQGASYEQNCEAEKVIAIHLNYYGKTFDCIQIYTPENPDEICKLFQQIFSLWKQKKQNFYYMCLSDLYGLIAQTGISLPKTNNSYGVIKPSIQYLLEHIYDTTLSLETVCKQSYISQTSFIKYFKKHFNCTPTKYVNQMRIQKAKLLLDSNLYTREEVARLCGYDNVKHFFVVFKQVTGLTPGQYLNSK